MSNVLIEYLVKNQSEFIQHEIAFEDYFDLDDGEEPEIDSVPKHSQPFHYLDIEVNKIILVKLTVQINDEKRVFNQTFWNEGNNFLTERVDTGVENYREIILSIKLSDNDNGTYEVLRLYVSSDFVMPTYHGVIHSDNDGKEIEQKFNTNVFLDMIKQGKFKTGN